MKALRISHLVEADLDEIWLYIAQHNPDAADRLMDRFKERFILFSENPELGELRVDLAPQLRQSIVGNYVILYRCSNELLEVVRVIHSSRDIPKEFRRRLFGKDS